MSTKSSPRRTGSSSTPIVVRVSQSGSRPANFAISETDRLETVLRNYCRDNNLTWGNVTFISQGQQISPFSRPSDLGLQGKMNLSVIPLVTKTYISPALTGKQKDTTRKTLTIKVTSPTGEVSTKRVPIDEPFKPAFDQLQKKWGLAGKPLKFLLNGRQLISADSTPLKHNLTGVAEFIAKEREPATPKAPSPRATPSKATPPKSAMGKTLTKKSTTKTKTSARKSAPRADTAEKGGWSWCEVF